MPNDTPYPGGIGRPYVHQLPGQLSVLQQRFAQPCAVQSPHAGQAWHENQCSSETYPGNAVGKFERIAKASDTVS